MQQMCSINIIIMHEQHPYAASSNCLHQHVCECLQHTWKYVCHTSHTYIIVCRHFQFTAHQILTSELFLAAVIRNLQYWFPGSCDRWLSQNINLVTGAPLCGIKSWRHLHQNIHMYASNYMTVILCMYNSIITVITIARRGSYVYIDIQAQSHEQ